MFKEIKGSRACWIIPAKILDSEEEYLKELDERMSEFARQTEEGYLAVRRGMIKFNEYPEGTKVEIC